MQLLLDSQTLAVAKERGFASKERVRGKYIAIAECFVCGIRQKNQRTQLRTAPWPIHHSPGDEEVLLMFLLTLLCHWVHNVGRVLN